MLKEFYLFLAYRLKGGAASGLVFFLAGLFLAVGLTTPGAVDDLATICGF